MIARDPRGDYPGRAETWGLLLSGLPLGGFPVVAFIAACGIDAAANWPIALQLLAAGLWVLGLPASPRLIRFFRDRLGPRSR